MRKLANIAKQVWVNTNLEGLGFTLRKLQIRTDLPGLGTLRAYFLRHIA